MSPLARFENADWSLVPPPLHAPLERWLVDGIEPQKSPFLRAVLKNDLIGAIRHARFRERTSLVQLVSFLAFECPSASFGSEKAYAEWKEIGGLRGVREIGNRPIYDEH